MPEQYSCGYQTRKQLYDKVGPREFHVLRFDAPDPLQEAQRFESLLRSTGRIDILCQGIGTSGHLALNEPHETDFNDSLWVRVVDVTEQSKRRLIDDPNFKGLGYIPDKGITMTIPAFRQARSVYTMVPLALKRDILTKLMHTPEPTNALPASVLRDCGTESYSLTGIPVPTDCRRLSYSQRPNISRPAKLQAASQTEEATASVQVVLSLARRISMMHPNLPDSADGNIFKSGNDWRPKVNSTMCHVILAFSSARPLYHMRFLK